ncbi:divalent cation tolerance protein CutA [Streptomyces sp. NBC_01508]|uniref:divalent cation tolerance protein CutA n=1 Tax=Streptomyces sp. NBC_01508 TaxID=2903888 RepID=UPI003869A85A
MAGYLAVLTTTAARYGELAAHIKSVHDYDTPEIIVTPIAGAVPRVAEVGDEQLVPLPASSSPRKLTAAELVVGSRSASAASRCRPRVASASRVTASALRAISAPRSTLPCVTWRMSRPHQE